MSVSDDDWETVGKALSNLSTPQPSERFVRKVMCRILEEERVPWWNLWKIPALGVGCATILFAVLTVTQEPLVSIDSYLLANIQDPIVSQWVSDADASRSPAPDEILQFVLEDSGGKL